jgi:uncharacterized protein
MMRSLGLMLALVLVHRQVPAQNVPPIIDMHMHAGIVGGDLSLGLCVPWVEQFPAWDPNRSWQKVWLEAMTNPPCSDPIWSPKGKTAIMEQTIAVLESRNIIGVLTGPREDVLRWSAAAPGRFIPSIGFKIGRDDISAQAMRELFESGAFAMLGEISNQYAGISPDDARMAPYWALAEELDVPVAIHMGEGTVGTALTGFPGLSGYRVRLSSPYLLEEVLIRHPRLRVSIMHYGSPLVDETIAMLGAYPQLYVDLGGRQWYYPRAYFYQHLRQMVDAGFGKRVMFGSDQGDWPGVIELAIRIIEEAPFLSEEQKRDILYNNAARFLRLSDEEIARHHGR